MSVKKKMREKIFFQDRNLWFYYIIKSKKDYTGFVEYIKKNQESISDELRNSEFDSEKSYVFKQCIFVDNGFDIGMGGYTLAIVALREFMARQKEIKQYEEREEQKKDSIQKLENAKLKQLPDIAYIAVNTATVYSHSTNDYGAVEEITKGTALRIIKNEGKFLYCDYTDEAGNNKTGWIEEINITYKKPKIISPDVDLKDSQ